MTKHEGDQLDEFWHELCAELICETLAPVEADRRMATADHEELSEAQIQDIVQRATIRRSSTGGFQPGLAARLS